MTLRLSYKLVCVVVVVVVVVVSYFLSDLQIVTLRLSYKLVWPEARLVVNESADWGEKGEINISPDNIVVGFIIILGGLAIFVCPDHISLDNLFVGFFFFF